MILSFALLAATASMVCSIPVQQCQKEGVASFTNMNNNFGNAFLKLLSSTDGNVFFSPSSLIPSLISVYFGAKGETASALMDLAWLSIQYEDLSSVSPNVAYCLELLTTLKSTSDEYTLERANAVLYQDGYPVLEEYKERLHSYFGSIVKNVDFTQQSEAIDEVNGWVEEKTHGKISKLVDEVDPSTKLLLLSAIYFKGTWQTEFDPENTRDRPFYNNGGSTPKSVPTMKIKTKYPYLYDEENQFRAVKLPYKGEDISMLILLPFERDGIERLQNDLEDNTITNIIQSVEETEVTVTLPKFKLEYSKSLKDVVTAAGLGAMFSQDADFSGISGSKDLYVSDVVHKAVVEVNEEGSEAAAVSGAIMVPISAVLPNPRKEFTVDHPFIFYIIDNRSLSNLFVGRVNEL